MYLTNKTVKVYDIWKWNPSNRLHLQTYKQILDTLIASDTRNATSKLFCEESGAMRTEEKYILRYIYIYMYIYIYHCNPSCRLFFPTHAHTVYTLIANNTKHVTSKLLMLIKRLHLPDQNSTSFCISTLTIVIVFMLLHCSLLELIYNLP